MALNVAVTGFGSEGTERKKTSSLSSAASAVAVTAAAALGGCTWGTSLALGACLYVSKENKDVMRQLASERKTKQHLLATMAENHRLMQDMLAPKRPRAKRPIAQESQESRKRRRVSEVEQLLSANDGVKECSICFNHVRRDRVYVCPLSHDSICSTCITSHLKVSTKEDTLTRQCELTCPCYDPTQKRKKHQVPLVSIAKHAEKEAESYIRKIIETANVSLRHEVAQLKAERLDFLRDGKITDPEKRELLRLTVQKEMPNARMCPHCKFGPIDVDDACDNLSTHDGQRNRHGGVINNICPNCGVHFTSKKQLPRWNGDTGHLKDI